MDGILFQSCASHKQPGFSYPASLVASHEWLPHLPAKKTSQKLKLSLISDNRASGGTAVSSFIYRLYAFIVIATMQPWGLHWKLISEHTFFFWKRWRCARSNPAKNVICLFCSGRRKRRHGLQPAKVTSKVLHPVTRETWAVIAC